MEAGNRLPPALAGQTLMYRLKVLTGPCLWARQTGSQATEVSIRVGVLNRMVALARPQSVRIA